MHVTSPDYDLAPNAAYKPSLHSLDHAMKFENTISVPNIVLVQPSIYGDDNSCLLDALKEIGPQHGRGVVGIDPDTINAETLRQWHELGVRGARLNLKSTNVQFTEASLRTMLESYAQAIKPFGWVLEIFIAMEAIQMLEPIVPELGVKVCIAHFGTPALSSSGKSFDPYHLPGFQSLVNLLRAGDTWVKLSAAYRFDNDPKMRGTEIIAKEFLRNGGERAVFASDWPHTRFEGLDVKPFVERCLEWTESTGLTEKVFTLNPEELWDAK